MNQSDLFSRSVFLFSVVRRRNDGRHSSHRHLIGTRSPDRRSPSWREHPEAAQEFRQHIGQTLGVPGERFRAHVIVHKKAMKRAQNVGHLEYEITGLQRRRRVPGHVATEHCHPA